MQGDESLAMSAAEHTAAKLQQSSIPLQLRTYGNLSKKKQRQWAAAEQFNV